MSNVRVVVQLCTRQSDVFHDLVLAFPWYIVARENDLYLSPIRIFGNLLIYEVFQLLGQFRHEFRP